MAAAQDVLAAEASSSPWRGIGHAVIGLTQAAHGDWEPARASVRTWVEIGRHAGQAVPQISGLANSAAWSIELGNWEQAASQRRGFAEARREQGYTEHWICAGAHFARARVLERSDDARGGKGADAPGARARKARCRTGDDGVAVDASGAVAGDVRRSRQGRASASRRLGQRLPVRRTPRASVRWWRSPSVSWTRADEREPASEGLSDRELDVLRLLATDLTQREIASQLYLSFNTVKSHTRSIFRKLGVSGREQAVARARELELPVVRSV